MLQDPNVERYVQQQLKPLIDRIKTLENKVSQQEQKISDLKHLVEHNSYPNL